MKSLVKYFSVISLLFLFSALGFSQDTVTITLIVDTANFDKDNWLASTSMVATRSDPNSVQRSIGDLREFTVKAFVGDTIIFDAKSKSSDKVIVDIKRIKRTKRKGTIIFENRRYCGENRDGSKNKTVKVEVLKDTEDKEDYEYNICFKINSKGKTYKIDPKLRIMPR